MRGSAAIIILLTLSSGCRPPPAESPPPPDVQDVQEEQDVEPALTQDELEAIRSALAAAIESSDNKELGKLTGNTATTPCTIDEDGTARIGLWVLWEAEESGLRFVWRRAGTYGPAFFAEVERNPGGWVVTDLGPMHISPPKK